MEGRHLRRRLMESAGRSASEHEAGRRRGRVDVALDLVRAGDAAEDRGVEFVLDQRDGEVRRVGAEAREAVVADEEHALGEVALAGDGEVPRQVEVVARHAGRGEGGEELSMWARRASLTGSPVGVLSR